MSRTTEIPTGNTPFAQNSPGRNAVYLQRLLSDPPHEQLEFASRPPNRSRTVLIYNFFLKHEKLVSVFMLQQRIALFLNMWSSFDNSYHKKIKLLEHSKEMLVYR